MDSKVLSLQCNKVTAVFVPSKDCDIVAEIRKWRCHRLPEGGAVVRFFVKTLRCIFVRIQIFETYDHVRQRVVRR